MGALAICLAAAGAVPVSAPARAATDRPTPAQAVPGLGPITFRPLAAGASETINALYVQRPGVCPANQPQPLTAAYPGTLEVGRSADGTLYLISQLTFSQYLKGIAEVPASWPMAALQAQVVAARTYALSHMNGPTVAGLSYNLCSTDACQVYRGLGVEKGPYGQAWAQAVDSTAGQILQYQGQPADTFYFSTSNGHTYSNSDVFGGPPLPYLQPVVENDDGASNTSNWSVTMPLTDLAQALSLGGRWGGGPIASVALQGSTVALSGPGQSTTMALSTFRNTLNNNATCLQPARYPSGSLPQTVPSIWMTLLQQGDKVVMTGRGWGHGVGMVQWGAEGKAARGLDYRQILGYYYGGLQPVTVAEPGSIRVLIATDLQQVTVSPSGSVAVSGGPGGGSAGPVTITGGSALTIGPAAPLASGGVIPPTVALGSVTASPTAGKGSPALINFALNQAANVGLTYQLKGATATAEVAPVPLPAGNQTIRWDALATGVAPGSYQVAVVADDGISRVVSSSLPISVEAAPAPSPAHAKPPPKPPAKGKPGPTRPGPTGSGLAAGSTPTAGTQTPVWLFIALGAFLVLALAGGVLGAVAIRRHQF